MSTSGSTDLGLMSIKVYSHKSERLHIDLNGDFSNIQDNIKIIMLTIPPGSSEWLVTLILSASGLQLAVGQLSHPSL